MSRNFFRFVHVYNLGFDNKLETLHYVSHSAPRHFGGVITIQHRSKWQLGCASVYTFRPQPQVNHVESSAMQRDAARQLSHEH